MNKKLQSALKQQKKKTEQTKLQILGTLGIPLGGSRLVEVPNRNSFVYVQLRSNQNEIIQAFNNKVSPSYGLPVMVQREGTRYVVMGVDTQRYQNNWNSFAPYLPRHGNTHSFDTESGGAGDITWVYSKQFMPLLPIPSGSSGGPNVIVSPHVLESVSGTWMYVGNTGTQTLLQYVPTGSNAVMVLVYLDRLSGNPYLIVNSGSYFSNALTGTAQIVPYIPAVQNPYNHVPLGAIRLVTGTSYIGWNNIYDVRQYLQYISSGTVTGGGGGSSVDTIGIAGLYNGSPIGTGTFLNVRSHVALFTRSGSMLDLFITGSTSTQSVDTIGFAGLDEGIPIGTGTFLNVRGDNAIFTKSGSMFDLYITGTSSTFLNANINGVLALDEGVLLGTGSIFNFRGDGVTATISGSSIDVYIPGGGGVSTGTCVPSGTLYVEYITTGTQTAGQVTNRTSGGTYTSHRSMIYLNHPILLKTVQWDVANATVYGVRLWRGWSTGTNNLYDFGTSGSAGASTLVFGLTGSTTLELLPGPYMLELRTTGSATVADNTNDTDTQNAANSAFSSLWTYYNTSKDDTFSPAYRLEFFRGEEKIWYGDGNCVGGSSSGIDTIGIAGLYNGSPIGTGTFLNVRGSNVVFTKSGSMFDMFITGSGGVTGDYIPITGGTATGDITIRGREIEAKAFIHNDSGISFREQNAVGNAIWMKGDIGSGGISGYFRSQLQCSLSTTELISNGSFESGTFVGWTQAGSPTLTEVDPFRGRYSAKCTASGTITQTATVVSGSYYLLEFAVKMDSDSDFHGIVEITNGDQASYDAGNQFGSQWIRGATLIRASATTMPLKFKAAAGTNFVYFDDITLKLVNVFSLEGMDSSGRWNVISSNESSPLLVQGQNILSDLNNKSALDGWNSDDNSWTFLRADSPSFEIYTGANVTGTFGVGYKFRCTHSSQQKMFFITAVGVTGSTTYLNLYGGTDYTLSAGAISNPRYSNIKAPFGFPLSPSKWTVTSTDTSTRTKTTPTDNTWYGETNAFDASASLPDIVIPVGVWNVIYTALVRGEVPAASSNFVRIETTLSTSGNSASDNDLVAANSFNAGGDGAGNLVSVVALRNYPKILELTTKTTYYLLAKIDVGASPTSLQVQGAISTTTIKAVCGFL